MPFGIPAEQIVDAEVVGASPGGARDVVINFDDRTEIRLTPPSPADLARARAIAVYLKLPFFAFIAFNGKVPGWIRLGAAVLGALEATQLAREHGYDYVDQGDPTYYR